MGTATAVEQVLETNIRNEIKPELDASLRDRCVQSVDATQQLGEITIKKSQGVNIEQINEANSICAMKTVMDFLDKLNLSEQVIDKALNKVLTQGGLGITVSKNNQNSLTKVETVISPKVKFDVMKECLQKTLASQSIEKVDIEESSDVVISQTNKTLNKCMQDSLLKLEQKYGVNLDIQKTQESESQTTGWDPIKSILNAITGPWALSGLAIVVCLILVCVGVIVFFLIMGSASGGSSQAPQQIVDRSSDLINSITPDQIQALQNLGELQ